MVESGGTTLEKAPSCFNNVAGLLQYQTRF